jgi:hypothetical protein
LKPRDKNSRRSAVLKTEAGFNYEVCFLNYGAIKIMTTTLEQVDSLADSGESPQDRGAFLDVLVGFAGNTAVGATYYDDDATGQDQFPHTD